MVVMLLLQQRKFLLRSLPQLGGPFGLLLGHFAATCHLFVLLGWGVKPKMASPPSQGGLSVGGREREEETNEE